MSPEKIKHVFLYLIIRILQTGKSFTIGKLMDDIYKMAFIYLYKFILAMDCYNKERKVRASYLLVVLLSVLIVLPYLHLPFKKRYHYYQGYSKTVSISIQECRKSVFYTKVIKKLVSVELCDLCVKESCPHSFPIASFSPIFSSPVTRHPSPVTRHSTQKSPPPTSPNPFPKYTH